MVLTYFIPSILTSPTFYPPHFCGLEAQIHSRHLGINLLIHLKIFQVLPGCLAIKCRKQKPVWNDLNRILKGKLRFQRTLTLIFPSVHSLLPHILVLPILTQFSIRNRLCTGNQCVLEKKSHWK